MIEDVEMSQEDDDASLPDNRQLDHCFSIPLPRRVWLPWKVSEETHKTNIQLIHSIAQKDLRIQLDVIQQPNTFFLRISAE